MIFTNIQIYRYLQSGEEIPTPYLRMPMMDEQRKVSYAKYKMVGIIQAHCKNIKNYIYKLDARSIRYARVKIIENKKQYAHVFISGEPFPRGA